MASVSAHRNRPAVSRRSASERGSALVLFPVAVLIVVFLAALCVDASRTFLGQRELANAAEAAANDAAAAINRSDYYNASAYVLDAAAAATGPVAVGTAAIRARIDDRISNVDVRIIRTDGTHVRVEITGEVPLMFARAIPGVRNITTVHASAEAVARQR